MTITCPHCGPVTVEDRTFVLAVRQVLDALSVGAAPLGGITCPLCRDEVRAKDVRE